MNEKRQSVRVQCYLPVQIKSIDSNGSQAIENGLVVNISRTGLCVRISQFIPLVSHLYIHLNFPNRSPIEMQVVPTRISELPHLEKYEIGGQFVELSPEDENAIQSFQYKTLFETTTQQH